MDLRTRIRALLQWTAILLSSAVLGATLLFLFEVSRWVEPALPLAPQQAFVSGSIGTELIPVPVLEAFPELFPDKFPPNGGWMKKYGFIPPGWDQLLLKTQKVQGAPSLEQNGLPLGLSVSKSRPLSGHPSPMAFVGFGCATCHSTLIQKNAADPGVVVLGPGNHSLNLLAFFENFKAAVMQRQAGSSEEYALTAEKIVARQREMRKPLGALDELVVKAWINQARKAVAADIIVNDEPRVGDDLYNSRQNRAGPQRSNPFRSLVRSLLDRPGRSSVQDDLDMGFVKFAAVFEQGGKEWAQFDGTVRKLTSRSALAALSAGASLQNLSQPMIMHNITAATDYVTTLEGPRWDAVFPDDKIDQPKALRGLAVYRQHCSTCHGYRDPASGRWLAETAAGIPNRLGEVVKVTEIMTDPERLTFSHIERLPKAFHDFFGNLPNGLREGLPDGHPFALPYDPANPGASDIRAATGYLNAPLPGAFLRAPYFHNASVMTMQELINLAPRRSSFYRGANYYDIAGVGLASPDSAEPGREWKYDTTLRGNSNGGHDFPWPYSEHFTQEQRGQLEDLLEYTKTL